MGAKEILQNLASGERTPEQTAETFVKLHADQTSSEVSREQDEGDYSEENPLVVWAGRGFVEEGEDHSALKDISRSNMQRERVFRQSNEGRLSGDQEDGSRFRGERLQLVRRERRVTSEESDNSERRREAGSSKAVRVWSGVKRVGSFAKDNFFAMSEFAAEHPKKFIIGFAGTATVISVPILILAGNGFWAVAVDAATTFGVSGTSALISQPALAKFHNWREGRKRGQVRDSRKGTFGFEARLGQPFIT